MVAKGLVERDSARGPISGEHVPNQVLARDQAPRPGVAGRLSVVAHHQEVALRDPRVLVPRRQVGEADRAVVAAIGPYVRLVQLLPVDVDEALALLPDLAGQADQALDERPLRTALLLR